MTGYQVAAKLVDRLNTSLVANFVVSWVDRSSGKFRLKIPASVTASVGAECQYDVLITEPGLDKFYILQGRAFLDPGITGVI